MTTQKKYVFLVEETFLGTTTKHLSFTEKQDDGSDKRFTQESYPISKHAAKRFYKQQNGCYVETEVAMYLFPKKATKILSDWEALCLKTMKKDVYKEKYKHLYE